MRITGKYAGKKGLSLWNEEEKAQNSDYSNVVQKFLEVWR